MDETKCPVCFSESLEMISFPCKHQFCPDCVVDLLQTGHVNCSLCRRKVFNKSKLGLLLSQRRVNVRPREQPSVQWNLGDIIMYTAFLIVGCSLCMCIWRLIQGTTIMTTDLIEELNLPIQWAENEMMEFTRKWIEGSDLRYRMIGIIHMVLHKCIYYYARVIGMVISALALLFLDFIGVFSMLSVFSVHLPNNIIPETWSFMIDCVFGFIESLVKSFVTCCFFMPGVQ